MSAAMIVQVCKIITLYSSLKSGRFSYIILETIDSFLARFSSKSSVVGFFDWRQPMFLSLNRGMEVFKPMASGHQLRDSRCTRYLRPGTKSHELPRQSFPCIMPRLAFPWTSDRLIRNNPVSVWRVSGSPRLTLLGSCCSHHSSRRKLWLRIAQPKITSWSEMSSAKERNTDLSASHISFLFLSFILSL